MTRSDVKRVVIWGTGFVGRMVIAEVVKHPRFELVGVGVSNPDKAGRDVGEICGLGRDLGLTATDDVDALIALKPDA
ncbi:dihydrodipicolinate reductase, partial [Mycobacterium sp. ITM-2017-0098]